MWTGHIFGASYLFSLFVLLLNIQPAPAGGCFGFGSSMETLTLAGVLSAKTTCTAAKCHKSPVGDEGRCGASCNRLNLVSLEQRWALAGCASSYQQYSNIETIVFQHKDDLYSGQVYSRSTWAGHILWRQLSFLVLPVQLKH